MENKKEIERNNRIACLKALFKQQAELQAQLNNVNECIDHYGRKYWTDQGYTVMPRIEKLKIALGVK